MRALHRLYFIQGDWLDLLQCYLRFLQQVVMWEICCRETPYRNLTSPHAIMKYVTIDKGRPDISKIPFDCPKLVSYPDFSQLGGFAHHHADITGSPVLLSVLCTSECACGGGAAQRVNFNVGNQL